MRQKKFVSFFCIFGNKNIDKSYKLMYNIQDKKSKEIDTNE